MGTVSGLGVPPHSLNSLWSQPRTPLQLPQTENPTPSALWQPRVCETISYAWSLTLPRPNLHTSKPRLLAMRGRRVKWDPPT